MTAAPLLDVRDLSVSLRVEGGSIPILDRVGFSLDPGKVIALVGESGSGKSVTAQSILRILPRTLAIESGEILFRARGEDAVADLARLDPNGTAIQRIRGSRIAMIFQEPMSSFSPLHTIGSQIGDVLRAHLKLPRRAVHDRVIELLDRVGVSAPARAVDQYPFEFSGGMRQRAMIAKALACNPSLLLADEPTTALDVTIQAQILELMRAVQAEFAMAIIFITHDLGIVARMADEVAIMYTGRIVERGPVREILRHPQHPYTASLIAAIPRLGDLRERRRLAPIRGTVPNLFEAPQGCTFHPRCDRFMPGRCELSFPAVTAVAPAHAVRCHLYG